MYLRLYPLAIIINIDLFFIKEILLELDKKAKSLYSHTYIIFW
jgi:hypothetical protein